jgi:hypothetical protein
MADTTVVRPFWVSKDVVASANPSLVEPGLAERTDHFSLDRGR